jgi:hypothetical protein
MKINLHIDRLVLDGLPVTDGDGARVRAAVVAELARLLAGGGLAPSTSLAEARVAAGEIHPGGGAGELGRAIGRQIYSSLNQTGHGTAHSSLLYRSFCSVQLNQQTNNKGEKYA